MRLFGISVEFVHVVKRYSGNSFFDCIFHWDNPETREEKDIFSGYGCDNPVLIAIRIGLI